MNNTMEWIQNNRRTATIVGLTLALPLLLVMMLLGDSLAVRQDYQRQIDRLEPRISRLLGLINAQEKLSKSSGKVDSRILKLVYPFSDDSSTISAALQTNVRDILSSAGLKVGNSRILPPVAGDRFERIGLSLTVSGDIAALDRALVQLAAYQPLLLVESIEVKPSRPARRGAAPVGQTMVATLQVLTLRAMQ